MAGGHLQRERGMIRRQLGTGQAVNRQAEHRPRGHVPAAGTWASGSAGRVAALALGLSALALASGCGEPDVPTLLASAQAAIAKQDIEAARVGLKSALQQQPNNAEARFLLGQLMLDGGDVAGAEAELRRAMELQHPLAKVLPPLAAAMLAQNKAALLLQQFGNARLDDRAAQVRLQTTLAQAEAATGNLDAALNRVEAVLRGDPAHGPAQLLQVRLTAARGDDAAALGLLTELLAKEPANSEAWQLKGDMLMRARPGEKAQSAAAAAAFQEALKHKADNIPAHVALIGLHLAGGDDAAANAQWAALQKVAPRHAQTLFLDAVLAQKRGDSKHAREVTQQLLRTAPNNPQVLVVAGESEARLGNLAQAEAHYAKALQQNPEMFLARQQLAQLQLRGGQPDKALATLGPLLERATPTVESLTLAAQAQLTKGDMAGADASFARAAKIKPDDQKVRMAMALSNLAKGKTAPALAELRAIAAADKSTSADIALIDALGRTNDLPGALKAVDNLAAKLPNDPLPDQMRGRIALQARDAATARKHFEAALAKNADYLPAMAGLAGLDMADKQPAAAKARFEAALQRNPKNTAAALALAELTARSGGKPEEVGKLLTDAVMNDPSDPAARMVLADHQLGTDQPKAALETARAGLAARPDNAELLDRLGRAQMATGDAQQAVATYTKLAAVAPRSALPQLRLADAQAAARNPSGVAAAVRKAAEIAPDHPQVLQAQLMMALQENRLEQALQVARKVQAQRPDDAIGYVMEGDVEQRRKNYDAAVVVLRKAVARKNVGAAPLRLHSALVAGGKTAEAAAMAQDWRQKHPDDLGFVMHLGDQAMAAGRLDEAEGLYRTVVDRQPTHVLGLNNLAYVLAMQKKPGAVAAAERAVKQAPKAAPLLDTLALALAAEQQLPRAVEVQKQAVDAAPDGHAFRLQLAKLLIQSGDRSAARSELSTLSALGNKYPRQAEVAALIKTTEQ